VTASVAHAAPEILEGKRPSEASDVYALASTINELIEGRAPFVRETDESMIPVIARIASDPPPDLSSYGVPETVQSVLERGLAKDPAARFDSATAFAKALREAAAGRTPDAASAAAPVVAAAPAPGGSAPSAPVADRERVRARRPSKRVLVALLLLVAIAGAAAAVATGGGGGGSEVGAPKVVAKIAVQGPVLPAVGEGAVFVITANGLVRINPASNQVSEANLGAVVGSALTVGEGSVWVAAESPDNHPELLRIDPGSDEVLERIALPGDALSLATGLLRSVWAVTIPQASAAVVSVRATPTAAVDTIQVAGQPISIAAGFDAVWLADPQAGVVLRLDPVTRDVTKIRVGRFPSLLTTGAGAVWVLDGQGGSVFRIDPKTRRVTGHTADLAPPQAEGGIAQALAVGLGAVWLVDTATATLLRVDPDSLDVVARLKVGRLPTAVAVGEGSVWVTDGSDNAVFRLRP
jgi:hypothetical protein